MKKFSLLLSMLLMAVMASAATTIYIDKSSVGNIWAWDGDGNYFDQWPGVALTTLDVATVDGVEYYTFVYSHEASGEGLIFNANGQQTSNLVPQDGAIYKYTGGTTVEVQGAEPVKKAFYLIGSFNGWDAGTQVPMVLGEDGNYTITQAMDAGAEFKLRNEASTWIGADSNGNFVVTQEQVENGTEITMLVGAGNNVKIPVAGEWTLTLNPETMKLVISGEWPSGPEPELEYYLVGDQMGWSNAEENKFAKSGDVYKLEKVFSGEFKIHTSTNDWYGNGMEFKPDNNTFELNENGDNMTIAAQEEPYTLTIENGVLTITGFTEEPVPDAAFYLIGSFNEWSQETMVPLFKGNDGLFVGEQAMEANAKFKLMNEHNQWIGAQSEGDFIVTQEQVDSATQITLLIGDEGQDLIIPVAGTWKFVVDPENMTLVIGGEWPVEPQPEPAFYLTGSFNEWDEETPVAMTQADGKFVVEQAMEANAEFKFLNENHEWIGAEADGNFIVTQEQVDSATAITLLVNGGNNIQIPVKGVWTLTIDPETMTLVIAGEWVEEPEPEKMVYILGNVVGDWDPTVGTPMVERGEGIYDLDITLVDAYEGNAYIGFTTKLADPESETPWDDIDEFRFGPVSEGDFVLTPELMETDIAITFDAHETVQAPAGKYWILVDFNDMKLIMKRMETTGDVNGDGAVDGNDLNMLINIVLGKEEATPGAEIDGQEGINGGDINTLINILLGKN